MFDGIVKYDNDNDVAAYLQIFIGISLHKFFFFLSYRDRCLLIRSTEMFLYVNY